MSSTPKRLCLTFETNFQTQSEIQDLKVVHIPRDEEEEEDEDASSISSSSFTFLYPSTSSSPVSSPVITGTPVENEEVEEEEEEEEKEKDEEEEDEKDEEEKEVEIEKEQEEEKEKEEEGKEEMEERQGEREVEEWLVDETSTFPQEERQGEREVEEWLVDETSTFAQGPPISWSLCYLSSSTSDSSSDENFSWKAKDPSGSVQSPADAKCLHTDLLQEKVADLVHFMILKYRLRKLITQEEMLMNIKNCEYDEFPVIFQRACKCLEVISGIDVKEVKPAPHSYVLVNSLDLTYDEMQDNESNMPTNGLLVITLGVIFAEGNSASEENLWDFLNILELYPGREHFLCGEPRKLLVRDWVEENYLVRCPVPGTDPPKYKFLWGPRAHAEISQLQVLEFLVKIKATDPISHYFLYQKALLEIHKQTQARIGPMDLATAMFSAQFESAASPFPTEESA